MSTPEAEKPKRRSPHVKREHVRLAVAALLGVLITAFALLNLDSVEVNWILGTWSTPLIVVIVVSLLFGVAIDRFLVVRSARRHRR